jgi:hydroxymethylglutaryl-CoA lyase
VSQFVELIEVGLRDGLQNERVILPTETKIDYANRLIAAGFKRIQVTSFVNPAKVPQMADADALCAQLPKVEGVEFSGLVLNFRGVARLHGAGLHAVDMGVSASDTHSTKNTGKPTSEKVAEMHEMIAAALDVKLRVRAAVQCAFGCVYEGAIAQGKVLNIAKQFVEQGAHEIALADSTGMANPRQIREMVRAARSVIGDTPLVLHLHDTRGMGLANVLAALEEGVSRFDVAFGGLGGCPFIREAAGNIPTEDTANMLHAMGYTTGIHIAQVAAISHDAQAKLGTTLPSKMAGII